ncbi:EAL domain-containing protein [Anaerocolumna sp. MB42-C2]|uniref:EAL domain-containing protein n=1 Tax=Anaerocolumna sp. MB42-C2 TaxID=3070997 RepID=UPI0027E1E570|nr:EAL domain-containing protein [Anaerocolumna sp. MB42-C2]WMJ89612.1 EAL domain-containing protein [Anaerocolumna sp. MB42-C2]
MSIKKTLRITLIIFSIVPIIIVSILAYQLIAGRLISIKRDNLNQLAVTNSNGLKAMVKNQQTEINLLAIQNQIYNLALYNQSLVHLTKKDDKDLLRSAMELLKKRHALYPSCSRITVYNTRFQAIASSDKSIVNTDYSDSVTLSYIKATGCAASGVSGLIKNPQLSFNDITNKVSSYCIEIGCPITTEIDGYSTIIGYIISTIDLSYFKDFLSSIKMGETGFGLVLDKSGIIVYHPDSRLIGTSIDNEKLGSLVSSYYTGKISQNGAFSYTYDNIRKIYGYSVIPELDWVLLVKQDVSEIIHLAVIIIYVLGWTVVILIIFMIFVSNKFAKSYTDPIIDLKDVMRTASDGNLEVQSNIKANNEFGELSRSFNKMLHIIKGNYNELTAMHEELITNEEQLRNNYNKIEYLAYHDILTNLPNKLAFTERVNSTLSLSPGSNKVHAVYFVDLDNFKTVNDTLGHDYGDNLLTQTAEQLLSLITSDDILARAGGDEFLIFRENLSNQREATEFGAKVIDAFKKPFNLNGEIAYVSMSIGIAIYPKNGTLTNVLIKNADIAMYKSKDTGKNKYTLFDKSMEDELNRNTIILEILRKAIENNEIYVKYQPQVNIITNKIIGFEALMRIKSAKLGELSPTEFIPIAEESGLIVELGEWILKEACRFNKNLMELGYTPYIVSVNISSVQINRTGFITMLDNVLKETSLPPRYLELEITESTIVSSITDAVTLLNSLQALGVRISLDDFGTGYSSLNYLTSMPINTLKIDKSFIDNISKNEKDSLIAEAIIHLAHSIDVEVIAEGVEFNDQLSILQAKNCDIIQGYIYSKPLNPSRLLSVLDSDKVNIKYTKKEAGLPDSGDDILSLQ